MILKGAKIGDRCVVGAGAVVVSGNYPSDSLIAGNPAKIVKRLDVSVSTLRTENSAPRKNETREA